ncbi:hypothetical protein DFJ58DRAFT_737721 [Suillus subalutaceus]|uniref:uncharacterized protein n=1 Tax=Suillus subalutaceus TaxID=48586 RepID=UPI001B867822|nr:uncharacterized protein DFJ58DRAFT_737721 [Suillus subalutaceus]KAG1828592.1 hypothetical protein DFJ58DRAFT_737721 [Suillus subalutaceus]
MAVATHISCEIVRGWVKVPTNDILSVHEVMYNLRDPDVREPVDLLSLPLHESETHKEINIYDKEGRRIHHLIGRNCTNAPQCSILVNIKTISQLFSLYVAHDEHLDIDADIPDLNDEQAVKINVYPRAFLHKYGHLQSDSILPHFKTFVSKVQANITWGQQCTYRMDDDDNEHMKADDGQAIPPAIIGSGCQFYNEISHQIQPNTGLGRIMLCYIFHHFVS